MSRRFKKNNIISDSESDEDVSDADSESSSSTNYSDPEDTSASSDESPHPVSLINDSHEESAHSVSSSEKENSSNRINVSRSSSEKKTPEQRVTKERKGSRQSIAETSVNCEHGDILVSESSISVVQESFAAHSSNEISEIFEKTPHRKPDPEKSKIIVESSESDNSLECIDSFQSRTGNESSHLMTSKSKSEQSISEIEVIDSPQSSHDSLKNLSGVTIGSNNSLSQSGISSAAHSSIQSNSSPDERKSVERQLTDKIMAYKNIKRAVQTCDPRKLKDGGKLLQEKLAKCKEEVDELQEKLKNMVGDSVNNPSEKYKPKSNTLYSISDQVTANLGKKGMETHRVEAALTVDALVTLHGSLQTCPAENVLEKDPKGLRVELMPHQKYALAWLLWREQQIPPGGILADDMGLGKTLTMVAFVLRSEEYKIQKNLHDDEGPFMVNDIRMYPGKTLVVCPSSLMGQWQGQITEHCRSNLLSTLIHHGKPRELQAKRLAAPDIVITSYGVVVEENKIIKGDKKGPLFRVKWERIIIDEGHVIRNHKTKTAQAVCELEAKYRWCLTGTPVQNKELDMYSLLKFLRCAPFDNLSVWKRWVDNKSANGVQRLNTVVKSILLRRTKEELKNLGELQELPTKTSIPVYIKLDEEEQKVYHTVLHLSKSLLAEFLLQEEKKHGYVNEELRSHYHKLLHTAKEIKTTEIFVFLLRLRQICCLPGLIHAMLEKETCAEVGIDPEDDPVLQDLMSHMKRMSVGAPTHVVEELEGKKKILIESNPVFHINRPSGKIRKVVSIIKEALDADDKIVIVSQWANLLQRLKTHIVPLGVRVVILDGSVPVKLRPRIIEDFNRGDSDVKVMLLSLTAGGVGLNLMGGNRLVIFEPHWNPQLESQACDRIHRVGQKKQVYIYKIICQETIEEKIELLQKKKLEIADTVLKGELKMTRTKLTLADLKLLFDVHS